MTSFHIDADGGQRPAVWFGPIRRPYPPSLRQALTATVGILSGAGFWRQAPSLVTPDSGSVDLEREAPYPGRSARPQPGVWVAAAAEAARDLLRELDGGFAGRAVA
jgi:hypothetical protein